MEAMLRTCGDALRSSACETTGACCFTSAFAATSLMRASAPMRRPPGTASTLASGRALTSTTCAGISTPDFIRSTRLVPPATNRPPEEIAPETSAARRKLKGCMSNLRLHGLALRLADRSHDAGVGAAAADVAAHPLADLVVVARVPFVEQRPGRTDLPRRAVAALEAVVADEGRLHRMQPSFLRQPF